MLLALLLRLLLSLQRLRSHDEPRGPQTEGGEGCGDFAVVGIDLLRPQTVSEWVALSFCPFR